MDADELKACQKLRKQICRKQIWMVRVGSTYVHRIGGRERQDAPRSPDLSNPAKAASVSW